MQNSVRQLMSADDLLKSFSELAMKAPDLMRLLLQDGMAALVNVQSFEWMEAEIRWRAVKRN